MFPVSAKAQQVRDNQLWAAAGARGIDRSARYRQTGFEIRSVQEVTGNSITFGAIDQGSTGILAAIGSGIGILVVGHDNNYWQTFHRSLVDCFMESARRRTTFTDAGCSDSEFDPAKPPGQAEIAGNE